MYSDQVNNVYRVKTGTGMGNVHSGETADLNFYYAVEKDFATDDATMNRLGIELYVRFRDDILVFMQSDGAKVLEFLQTFKQLSATNGYIIERDGPLELNSISYLDVTLFKDEFFNATGMMLFKPYTKPTAQKTPLSDRSMHAGNVAKAWPVAEVGRLRRRASIFQHYKEAVGKFVDRLQRAFHGEKVVNSVLKTRPDQLKLCYESDAGFGTFYAQRSKIDDRTVFWVLPFHPSMEKQRLQLSINAILRRWCEHDKAYQVVISWQQRLKPLGATVRSFYQMASFNGW